MLMSNDLVISLMDEISWGVNTFFRHYVYCHVWEPSRVCRRYGTMTREIWPLIKQLLHGYNSLIWSMTLLDRQCEVCDCIVSHWADQPYFLSVLYRPSTWSCTLILNLTIVLTSHMWDKMSAIISENTNRYDSEFIILRNFKFVKTGTSISSLKKKMIKSKS